MKKSVFFVGMLALALVFGFLVAGCATSGNASAGGAKDTYYVGADGNDSKDGLSESTAFKSLTKAVQAANKNSAGTIVVIGKLETNVDIELSGKKELLITGKPDAVDSEKASLIPAPDVDMSILSVRKGKIRFESITICDSPFAGVVVGDATVTFGKDSVVKGNHASGIMSVGGDVILESNALVTENENAETAGGGIYIGEGASFLMKDDAIVSNNKSIEPGLGGGIMFYGSLGTIQDNAKIIGNSAELAGGGIGCETGNVTILGNAEISGNTAKQVGGGIFLQTNGMVNLQGNAVVKNNSAGSFGGGLFVQEMSGVMMKGNPSVTNNEAARKGGGVVVTGCESPWGLHQNGGTVTGNKAPEEPDIFIE